MKIDLDKGLLLACAAILAVLPFVASGYVLFIVNLLMVYIVLALGLHIVLGETGQFALAHIAFYGIGIYTAGIINNAWHPNFVISILVSAVVAGVLGYMLGALAIRMRDIYLALSTFAFGEAMQWVFLNWVAVTNGSNGYRMSPAQFFGFELVSDLRAYPFVVLAAGAMLGLTVYLSRSQLGSAFRAVRESDVAAQAMGVNVNRVKRIAFMISAAYAGLAGGLFTTFSSFIHPDSLGFQATVLILIMIVVGGIGSVRGAIAGAVIFGLISELLRQVLSFQEIIYGAILIVFMMFLPKGLFSGRESRRSVIAREAGGKSRVGTEAKGTKA
ncbi:branched-chain amino acid ABC transporter permease [Alcaligenaceae bacterium]|nr:branched-chain amino acid ABC transporter permease [Alcaligenaceae bacterium]